MCDIMKPLRIRIYDDPVLREKARAVETFDAELRDLALAMGEKMYDAPGIGLAGPQIGVLKRIFVSDVDWVEKDEEGNRTRNPEKKNLRVFINPEILWESEEDDSMTEGCLSIPGIEGEVYRPTRIKLRFSQLDGKTREEEMEGLLARCAQHEIDHLDGVLFIDRLPFAQRAKLAGALNRLKKKATEK